MTFNIWCPLIKQPNYVEIFVIISVTTEKLFCIGEPETGKGERIIVN